MGSCSSSAPPNSQPEVSTDQHSVDLDDLEIFREFARTKRRSLRNQIFERHMGLATHISQRFAHAGRHNDDLRQVAMIGLVKSVDRFDPEYGVAFSSFAGRTIEGELKRHFRDASWTIKVPRQAKELHLLVRDAARDLEQRTGASPTVDQLAAYLQIEHDDVLRGLAASAASSVDTIDRGTDDGASFDRQARLATEDRSYEDAENAHIIEQLIVGLSGQQRRIIELRFYEEKSQTEIAEEVGVSQMHVSRLLKQSFEQMRELYADQ
jgi:RNA polymerase sigma-B factor